jgi:hypothetical protein
LAVVLLSATSLTLAGCSQTEEPPRTRAENTPVDEQTAEAARTRGVAEEGYGDDTDPVPRVLLSEMSYEWRVSPEKGLLVTLEFTNPADTYERARGYVFLVAEYEAYGSIAETGVYPWNTTMAGNLPEDYTDGSHLLYRDEQTVRAFIPFERADGYYNKLRLYLYHEDGRLITNRTYDLDIAGTPGDKGSFRPGFDL